MNVCHSGAMADETQLDEDEGEFDDVMADEDEAPLVDDYQLSTRPGVVSGES